MKTRHVTRFNFSCFIDDDLVGVITDYLWDFIMEYRSLEDLDRVNVEELSKLCWPAAISHQPTVLDDPGWLSIECDIFIRHSNYVKSAKSMLEWILDENQDEIYNIRTLNITDVWCIGSTNLGTSFMLESE